MWYYGGGGRQSHSQRAYFAPHNQRQSSYDKVKYILRVRIVINTLAQLLAVQTCYSWSLTLLAK